MVSGAAPQAISVSPPVHCSILDPRDEQGKASRRGGPSRHRPYHRNTTASQRDAAAGSSPNAVGRRPSQRKEPPVHGVRRFFAAQEIKIIIAYFLLTFDFRFRDEGVEGESPTARPPNLAFELQNMADPSVQILLRRRKAPRGRGGSPEGERKETA